MYVEEYADADVVQTKKETELSLGKITKTFPFNKCNPRAVHSTDCINSFDKEYNGQLYCLVGEEVSLVSSLAQLKSHCIVKQNIFCTVLPGRYMCLMLLLYSIVSFCGTTLIASALTLLTLLWSFGNTATVWVCLCLCDVLCNPLKKHWSAEKQWEIISNIIHERKRRGM